MNRSSDVFHYTFFLLPPLFHCLLRFFFLRHPSSLITLALAGLSFSWLPGSQERNVCVCMCVCSSDPGDMASPDAIAFSVFLKQYGLSALLFRNSIQLSCPPGGALAEHGVHSSISSCYLLSGFGRPFPRSCARSAPSGGLRCCCWFIHQNPLAESLTGPCSNTGLSYWSVSFPCISLSSLFLSHFPIFLFLSGTAIDCI